MNRGMRIAAAAFLLLAGAGALVLAVLGQYLFCLAFLVCAALFYIMFLVSDGSSGRR